MTPAKEIPVAYITVYTDLFK